MLVSDRLMFQHLHHHDVGSDRLMFQHLHHHREHSPSSGSDSSDPGYVGFEHYPGDGVGVSSSPSVGSSNTVVDETQPVGSVSSSSLSSRVADVRFVFTFC